MSEEYGAGGFTASVGRCLNIPDHRPRIMRIAVATISIIALSACSILRGASAEQLAPVETVAEHGLSKSEAFARMSRWAAETFVSGQDVIQLSDEDAGTIVAKGAIQTIVYDKLAWVGYTTTIDVRDGRVRFRQQIAPEGLVSESAAADVLARFEVHRAEAVARLDGPDDF